MDINTEKIYNNKYFCVVKAVITTKEQLISIIRYIQTNSDVMKYFYNNKINYYDYDYDYKQCSDSLVFDYLSYKPYICVQQENIESQPCYHSLFLKYNHDKKIFQNFNTNDFETMIYDQIDEKLNKCYIDEKNNLYIMNNNELIINTDNFY